VSVAIEALENGFGATKLSATAMKLAAWMSLDDASPHIIRVGRAQGEGRPHVMAESAAFPALVDCVVRTPHFEQGSSSR
jgi:hypothetical protein